MDYLRHLVGAENTNELHTLMFTKKQRDKLPSDTEVYQVEDGTLFYCQLYTEDIYRKTRLYAMFRDKEMVAQFPEGFSPQGVHAEGNAVYCRDSVKIDDAWKEAIFKCVFMGARGIRVTLHRYLEEDEKCVDAYLSGRAAEIIVRQGYKKKYIYRLNEDPQNDPIIVNLSEDKQRESQITAVHRGQAIFVKSTDGGTLFNTKPYVMEWDSSIIMIMIPSWDTYPRFDSLACFDTSPFIYIHISKGENRVLYVLDTRSMQFLPGLMLTGLEYFTSIISISKDGVLTVKGCLYDYFLMTAQLPTGYFDAESVYSEFLKKFEPRRVLGQGGFGIVFETRNLIDEWSYAVKRIAFRGSEDDAKDALKEVRVLASLKHEGIVGYNHSWIEKPPKGWQKRSDDQLLKKLNYDETLEYSEDCVFIYIQMELCKKSLHDWLYDNTTRDLSQAKSWFKQLVSAVGYLHQKNMIHRDLKPGNILFDANGRLKLCDLGLAAEKALRSKQEIDITRTIAGTPMYMPHEQAKGKYTSKVDVYSLGLILAELCVCMTIYEAYEAFMRYRQGKSTKILKNLPEVDQFVTWLTQYNPSKRPTCDEILTRKFLD